MISSRTKFALFLISFALCDSAVAFDLIQVTETTKAVRSASASLGRCDGLVPTQYYAAVMLGHDPVPYILLVDTGSAATAVRKRDSQQDYLFTGNTAVVVYEDDSYFEGSEFISSLTLGGYTAPQQHVFQITSGDIFERICGGEQTDGILGLSLQDEEGFPPSFYDNINVTMSYLLCPNSGQMWVGERNTSYDSTPLYWFQFTPPGSQFILAGPVFLGQTRLGGAPFSAFFDTGSTHTHLPAAVFSDLQRAVTGVLSTMFAPEFTTGRFCDTLRPPFDTLTTADLDRRLPFLTLTLGTHTFTLPASKSYLRTYPFSGTGQALYCFMALNAGSDPPVIGVNIMKNFVTTFDPVEMRLGLARTTYCNTGLPVTAITPVCSDFCTFMAQNECGPCGDTLMTPGAKLGVGLTVSLFGTVLVMLVTLYLTRALKHKKKQQQQQQPSWAPVAMELRSLMPRVDHGDEDDDKDE